MAEGRMKTRLPDNLREHVAFRNRLLRWYDANRRDLPWRHTKDPYRIWLSEIMLQQTRVGAVLDHYRRFLENYPDVQSLAQAREESVLAAWSGLGYYRRARNLHACAKVVAFERGGEFPRRVAELRGLPGIGRYTAAAIASIAFGEPVAVVDGNVERVLQRLTGDADLAERATWELAQELMSRGRPGDFNQAMMELGATVCLPRDPRCLTCPVMKHCPTRGSQTRRNKEERQQREISVGWSQRDGAVWLVQRPKSLSLMPGMWELPEIEANGHKPLARFKHSILNTDNVVSVCAIEVPSGKGRWIRKSTMPKVALTGLSRKILRHFGWL
jgi:A/G-specific adenine glycosylase